MFPNLNFYLTILENNWSLIRDSSILGCNVKCVHFIGAHSNLYSMNFFVPVDIWFKKFYYFLEFPLKLLSSIQLILYYDVKNKHNFNH